MSEAGKHSPDPPDGLLTIPSGVDSILIQMLSSREGGLYDILNLRLVCKTTKSWVDNLPLSQARRVFKNAQIKIESSTPPCNALQRFVQSPPGCKIASLFLTLSISFENREFTSEEKTNWEQFYHYWSQRLESLTLKSKCPYSRKNDVIKERMYSIVLKNHTQINFLDVSMCKVRDLKLLQKVLDLKKTDTKCRIRVSLDLIKEPIGHYSFLQKYRNFSSTEDKEIFQRLLESIIASEAKTELAVTEEFDLTSNHWIGPKILELLSQSQFKRLLKRITTIRFTSLSRYTENLPKYSPKLKKMEAILRQQQEVSQLRFPPSINEVCIRGGFPNFNLNDVLHSLTLLQVKEYRCTPNQFLSSIAALNFDCSNLETLDIAWSYESPEEPSIFDKTQPIITCGFSKLKALLVSVSELSNESTRIAKGTILRAFNWNEMQLTYLGLSFVISAREYIRVADAGMVSVITSGKVRETLVSVYIDEKATTARGTAARQRLYNLATVNSGNRLANEGRGKWQQNRLFAEFVDCELQRSAPLPPREIRTARKSTGGIAPRRQLAPAPLARPRGMR